MLFVLNLVEFASIGFVQSCFYGFSFQKVRSLRIFFQEVAQRGPCMHQLLPAGYVPVRIRSYTLGTAGQDQQGYSVKHAQAGHGRESQDHVLGFAPQVAPAFLRGRPISSGQAGSDFGAGRECRRSFEDGLGFCVQSAHPSLPVQL